MAQAQKHLKRLNLWIGNVYQRYNRQVFTSIMVLFAAILILLFRWDPAKSATVKCTNCSTNLVQALDSITSQSQLANIIKQYAEDVIQTEQQIRMVQQNVEQYQNMLQNTKQLSPQLVYELKGNLTRLAALSGQLKTQRGDVVALGEIFTNLYPEQGLFGEIAASSGQQNIEAATARYHEKWNAWSANVDRASQATFQLSGQQLGDLQQAPDRFQEYLDKLLSTPDGQMQAMQAGNQLAALQVQEARQLRELMATQAQSSLASQMKAEKEAQMAQEAWRDATKVEKFKGAGVKKATTLFK